MKIHKYILIGGERLDAPAIQSLGISQSAVKKFHQWNIKALSDSCMKGQEAFLELPATTDSRIFIKAFLYKRRSERNLCWYLGIELDKEIYAQASSYHAIIKGLQGITLEQVLGIQREKPDSLEINFVHPNNASTLGTPFEKLNGQNFVGDYPAKLNEFCNKISLNNLEDWFPRLFLAVNPSKAFPDFSCIVSAIRMRDTIPPEPPPKKPPEPVVIDIKPEPISQDEQHKKMRSDINALQKHIETLEKKETQKSRKRKWMPIINIAAIMTIFVLCIASHWRINSLKTKVENLTATPAQLQKSINSIEKRIETLEKAVKKIQSPKSEKSWWIKFWEYFFPPKEEPTKQKPQPTPTPAPPEAVETTSESSTEPSKKTSQQN